MGTADADADKVAADAFDIDAGADAADVVFAVQILLMRRC